MLKVFSVNDGKSFASNYPCANLIKKFQSRVTTLQCDKADGMDIAIHMMNFYQSQYNIISE